MATIQQRVTLRTDLDKLFATIGNDETAMELVKSAARQIQSQARDLKAEKVRALGDGEAFVRVADDGRTVRAIKQVVPLTELQGHFYCIPGWEKNGETMRPDKWKVSAEGYTWLNKFAGVSTLTPPMQMVDGRAVENPYIATDPAHPTIMTMVHVRVVALGRTAVGSLVAVDYHLRWDPVGYLIESLKAVQSKTAIAIRDVKGSTYQRKTAAGDTDALIFLPYAPAGFNDVLGLEVDVTNTEVQKKLKDYQQLVKFGERRARTICVRNALRHHPAIAVSSVEPIPVYGPPDANNFRPLIDRRYGVPIWAWVEGPNMMEETQAAARSLMSGAPLPEDMTVQTVHADNELSDDEDGVQPVPSSVADAEIVTDAGDMPREPDARPKRAPAPEPAPEPEPDAEPQEPYVPTPEEAAEILRQEREAAAAERGEE